MRLGWVCPPIRLREEKLFLLLLFLSEGDWSLSMPKPLTLGVLFLKSTPHTSCSLVLPPHPDTSSQVPWLVFLSSVLPAAAQVPGCLVAFPEVFLSDPSQLSSRVCLSLFFAAELLFLLSLNSFISETIKNPAGGGGGGGCAGAPQGFRQHSFPAFSHWQ